MQIGLLGLGKMGRMIAEKLLVDNHEILVWNRSKEALDNLKIEKSQFILAQKLQIVYSIEQFRDSLRRPRVIWTMLPAGEPTNAILQEVLDFVDKGDIVIDGGNAHFTDTEKWAEEFGKKEVKFLGVGVSGGIHAMENGCCLMIGGDRDAYEYCRPIFDSLARPNGVHQYFGTGGAGHFVKMVHNGVEYGMMQSLGEGFGVLAKSDYRFNLLDVSRVWQRGSVVQSFLLNMAVSALTKDPVLVQTEGIIDANGEAKWTIEVAKEMRVPVPVIEQSLKFRADSQYDKAVQDTFAAKLVQALRREFGGHEHKKEDEPQPQQ